MIKEYKRSILRTIFQIIILTIGVIFGLIITSLIMDAFNYNNYYVLAIIGIILILIAISDVLDGIRFKIFLDNEKITLKTGKKEDVYILSEVTFSSKIVNSDIKELYVHTKDKNFRYYDCTYLTLNDFEKLLEDLGVVGDKQAVRKLETKIKK